VDDEETICETLDMVFEQEGYDVDMANSGKDALALSNNRFYNLAVVDWRLPDIEGTQLLNEFKPTVPKMVKIMLTGYPSTNNAMAAVNNRADAFFMKPVDIDLLLAKMKELLKEQEEAQTYSEEKITQFIETRAKEIMQK
jgi:DNA-binding response OmpR family regulator